MFIKAKKSLGQNFLIDRNILDKIISTTKITNKVILEIGPGSGNLTTYILKQKPKKIFVVEKDDDLCLLLKEKFDSEITIINEDVLKISEDKISNEKLIVFGNLPYNISTEILSKWIVNLNNNFWFESLVLMFQKEVADRIIAESNTSKYGRLSILSNWKLNIKKIIDIKPQAFIHDLKLIVLYYYLLLKKIFLHLRTQRILRCLQEFFLVKGEKCLKNLLIKYLKIQKK